jgi:hypothetical protein
LVPIQEFLRQRELLRAPKTGYDTDDFKYDFAEYDTKDRGFEVEIDDEEAADFDDPLRYEATKSDFADDALLRGHECRVAALVFDTAAFTGANFHAFGAAAHLDATNVPKEISTVIKPKFRKNLGMEPNTLIIAKERFDSLRNHPLVIDKLANTQGGDKVTITEITEARLAEVFEVDRVLVGKGLKNTAAPGAAATLESIWSNRYGQLCYLDPNGSNMERPTLARTYHWTKTGSKIGGIIERYRNEKMRADYIRSRHNVHEQIVQKSCGMLIDFLAMP